MFGTGRLQTGLEFLMTQLDFNLIYLKFIELILKLDFTAYLKNVFQPTYIHTNNSLKHKIEDTDLIETETDKSNVTGTLTTLV